MKISIANANGEVTFKDNIEAKNSTAKSRASFDSALASKTATVTTTIADKLDTVRTYKSIFEEASAKYGVDYKLLVAMAQQESGFNPSAVSRHGAMGIMQLMPFTAEALGVTDPYDAYENIMGGADYISQKLAMYNGDVDLALAAYNAGSGAVAEYGGIPPFEETQNYVAKIKDMMASGFDVPVINYVSKGATEAGLASDLKTLLSEFSEHESYNEFLAELDTAMVEAAGKQTEEITDAQVAYDMFLNSAHTAIGRMLNK